MSREPKEYRSKTRIYADILNSILRVGGKSGPTHILLLANLSHDRLMRHLAQLVELELVSEEADNGHKLLYPFIVEKRRMPRTAGNRPSVERSQQGQNIIG
jgi:predicted transcriptional regulator